MFTHAFIQTSRVVGATLSILMMTGCGILLSVNSPLVDGGWEIENDIDDDLTLPEGTSYTITDAIAVSAQLTIEPGVTLEFAQGAEMRLTSDGTLLALGAEDSPIVFTGTTKTPGWWNGIYIRSSDDMNNVIDHAIIEYAGRSAMHGSVEPANLTVGRSLHSARIQVTNTVIRNSNAYGVAVHANGSLPDWSSNTITDNAAAAISTTASNIHYLDAQSSYTGNSIDAVEVDGNDVEMNEVIWQALDVPYHFAERTTITEGTLVFTPGITIAFEQGAQIDFRSGSEIIAEGSSDAPITFTATQETPGWWYGVYLRNSNSLNNRMDYVIVEYAGRDALHGSVEPANLTVGRSLHDAYVEVTNSEFRYSDGYGIYVHGNGTTNDNIESVNTFSNNAGGTVVMQ